MDFIHENNGLGAERAILFGLGHDILDFLDAAGDSGEVDEPGLGGCGDDAGQGGLADSRRAPEDHGLYFIAVNHPAQDLAFGDQLALAGIVFERFRPHAVSQRGGSRPIIK